MGLANTVWIILRITLLLFIAQLSINPAPPKFPHPILEEKYHKLLGVHRKGSRQMAYQGAQGQRLTRQLVSKHFQDPTGLSSLSSLDLDHTDKELTRIHALITTEGHQDSTKIKQIQETRKWMSKANVQFRQAFNSRAHQSGSQYLEDIQDILGRHQQEILNKQQRNRQISRLECWEAEKDIPPYSRSSEVDVGRILMEFGIESFDFVQKQFKYGQKRWYKETQSFWNSQKRVSKAIKLLRDALYGESRFLTEYFLQIYNKLAKAERARVCGRFKIRGETKLAQFLEIDHSLIKGTERGDLRRYKWTHNERQQMEKIENYVRSIQDYNSVQRSHASKEPYNQAAIVKAQRQLKIKKYKVSHYQAQISNKAKANIEELLNLRGIQSLSLMKNLDQSLLYCPMQQIQNNERLRLLQLLKQAQQQVKQAIKDQTEFPKCKKLCETIQSSMSHEQVLVYLSPAKDSFKSLLRVFHLSGNVYQPQKGDPSTNLLKLNQKDENILIRVEQQLKMIQSILNCDSRKLRRDKMTQLKEYFSVYSQDTKKSYAYRLVNYSDLSSIEDVLKEAGILPTKSLRKIFKWRRSRPKQSVQPQTNRGYTEQDSQEGAAGGAPL